MSKYKPIIISRYTLVELLKEIECKCYGKDAQWDVVSEIKHFKSDRPVYAEPYDKRKRPKRIGYSDYEVYRVALKKKG